MSDELLLTAPAVFPKDSQGNLVAIKTRAGLVVMLDGSNVEAEITAIKSAISGQTGCQVLDTIEARDALTGMNNRRKADEYLSEKLSNVSESEPLYLYMGDMNNFKTINDTYGHTEGDEALILCSHVLKSVIGRYNGFAARFGGDEFLMVCYPDKSGQTDPDSLVRDVDSLLEAESADKPYRLSMSIGYTLCANPKESLSVCIKRADEMLYQRKAAAHAGR